MLIAATAAGSSGSSPSARSARRSPSSICDWTMHSPSRFQPIARLTWLERPVCHDAAMWHWLERRITANPADPIPRGLTIGGLVMSAAAWIYGCFAGFGSFLLNTAAALGIVGPALLISNVVVKALQDARGRANIRPLLQPVNTLLCGVFDAVDPAFTALGYEGPRESHQVLIDKPDFAKLAAELDRTLRRLQSALSGCQVESGDIVRDIHPLTVPHFSFVSKLILQADRHYQMPWSVAGAVTAADWGETISFDFIYGLPSPPFTRDRKVGLAVIRGDSESANPTTTGATTIGYLGYVAGCLFYAIDIANKLANEAPAGLFAD
jgi:hypothetical protein